MNFDPINISIHRESHLNVLDCENEAWNEAIYSFPGHDIYDTAEYHRIASRNEGVDPRLFLFENAGYKMAIPLVLRPAPAKYRTDETWLDASSVYGYPGPLANSKEIPDDVRTCFQNALANTLDNLKVVSVFSRLNPFRPFDSALAGLGEVSEVGSTITICLAQSDEKRFAAYRQNHQDNIARLRATQAETIADSSLSHLEEFKRMYRHNMIKCGAKPYYFFDDNYFCNITSWLKGHVYFLVNKINDQMTSGALFLTLGDTVHAHLAATHERFRSLAPLKLLFDDAACFFRERGCRALHIGGGIGGSADSLFHFKSGFSKSFHPFRVWKWVVNEPHYETLCLSCGLERVPGFFPAYRRADDLV